MASIRNLREEMDTMQLSRRQWILSSLSVLALAGCSSLPMTSAQRFSGRFSGRFIRDGKTESLTGRYRYTLTETQSVLELLTPLYGVIARIVMDDRGATLLKGEDVVARAASAQSLMMNSVGFALPVEMLQSWLVGHAHEKTPHTPIDNQSFEQAGWRVDIKRRHSDGSAATIGVSALQAPYQGTTLTLTVEKE